jgi:hypothetical protein
MQPAGRQDRRFDFSSRVPGVASDIHIQWKEEKFLDPGIVDPGGSPQKFFGCFVKC